MFIHSQLNSMLPQDRGGVIISEWVDMEALTVGDVGAWCSRKCGISSPRKEVGGPLLGRQMSKDSP